MINYIYNYYLKKIIVLLAMFLTVNVFAWGVTGHRIVGDLAQRHLDEKVAVKVSKVLNGYKLQDISTWMDDIKSEEDTQSKSMYIWHFMDIKNPKTWESSSNTNNIWPRDIETALNYVVHNLKTKPKDAKFQQSILLKMLVHLVADAHQPLHVGNGNDLGANQCYVKWFYSKWSTSLHSVWDSKLIDGTKYSYSEYTDYLDHISNSDIQKWQKSQISTWLLESRNLHQKIYPKEKGLSPKKYCKRKRSAVEDKDIPVLGFKYSYKMLPILEKRLQKAGIRLAGIINDVYKD